VGLRAGTNGIVIADAVRIVPASDRVLDRPGELAVVDNGDPGFEGSSNGLSSWETVGRTSLDGEYAFLKGDNNGNEATWTVTVVPGTYQVAMTWQWAPYSRATDATYTINGGAPITLSQRVPPSDDQLDKGVVNVNGTDFQVLSSAVEVPPGLDTVEVRVTDDANSFVTLDAVMVQVVNITAVPSSFPLTAGGGAAPHTESAEVIMADFDVVAALETGLSHVPASALEPQVAPADDAARKHIFARVDGWLHYDVDDLADGPFDEDSDDPDKEANLLWAPYGQE
jgi:hypothetical protein